MNPDTILLVDADGDCEETVSRAAAQCDREVFRVGTSRDAFKFVRRHFRNLSLVIVDLDPGAHGMAILEAISSCANCPPLIVLTSLEETYAAPISRAHGASFCLAKPITIEKLVIAIEEESDNQRTCDLWGHIQPRPRHATGAIKKAVRGIAGKLSPGYCLNEHHDQHPNSL